MKVTGEPTLAEGVLAASVNARSDVGVDAPTTTRVCVELFACNGSAVSAFTDALLSRLPLAPALTFVTMENPAEVPDVNTEATHDTVPVDATAGVVQLHPLGTLIETNVVLAGRTEVKNGLLASAKPLFVTALE